MRWWRLISPFLWIVWGASGVAHGQDIKITAGVQPKQVIQRGDDDQADLKISGIAAAKFNTKFVEIRVSKRDQAVPGWDWSPLSERIKAGKWAGDVRRIPTGGPYKIEARISGVATATHAVEGFLVGDLWVLAGQSNMEGVGDLQDVQEPSEFVNSFDQQDQWVLATEPLHLLVAAVDEVHWGKRSPTKQRLSGPALDEYVAKRRKGAGLGLPFALELYRRSGVPIGLIPCAHGGTSMDEWSPTLKGEGGKSLYGATVRRIQAVGGKIRGVVWYQGESDASPQRVPAFAQKFEDLIAAFRLDAGDPKLPFYFVQLGRYINANNQAEWTAIREAQRLAETKIPNTGMVAAVDASLDDLIHIGTQDLKRLGRRLAIVAARDLFGSTKENAGLKRGPRLQTVRNQGGGVVKVSFDQVNERLMADGRIGGFSIHNDKGEMVPLIYKARFDPGDPNSILLYVTGELPAGAKLAYGWGKDPYCNVKDMLDMALPGFGPLPIQ